jgi:glycosyltransferase involved in cell wall biosynthesis
MVYDYFSICPRINMVDETGFYCGEPDDVGCNKCLRERGSEFGQPDIQAWRAGFRRLYSQAEQVVTPSNDVTNRVLQHFPEANAVTKPHELTTKIALPIAPKGTKPLKIGTIGAISAIKGFHVLCACASWAKQNYQDAQFLILGYTENDKGAERSGIELCGPYEYSKVLDEINSLDFDAIFLPSVCPETYSFTLSAALQTGLPIIVFDIGAPAEILRDVPQGLVLPLDYAKDPEKLVKRLVEHAQIADGAAQTVH